MWIWVHTPVVPGAFHQRVARQRQRRRQRQRQREAQKPRRRQRPKKAKAEQSNVKDKDKGTGNGKNKGNGKDQGQRTPSQHLLILGRSSWPTQVLQARVTFNQLSIYLSKSCFLSNVAHNDTFLSYIICVWSLLENHAGLPTIYFCSSFQPVFFQSFRTSDV